MSPLLGLMGGTEKIRATVQPPIYERTSQNKTLRNLVVVRFHIALDR